MQLLIDDVLLLLFYVVFSFVTLRNDKWGFLIIIFTLSIFNPFQKYIAFPMQLSIASGFTLLYTFIKYSKKFYIKQNASLLIKPSRNIYYIYYLLIIGIVMGLYSTSIGSNFIDTSYRSNYEQILNISMYFIVIICFYKALWEYMLDFKFQDTLMKVFCISVVVHLLLFLRYYHNPTDSVFFSIMNPSQDEIDENLGAPVRFMSYINDYELTVDYVIVLVGLCLISYYRSKKVYQRLYHVGIIILSILLGITTGTRSFIVVGAFIGVGMILVNIKNYKYVVGVSVLLLLIWNIISFKSFERYAIFYRFQETIEQYKSNESLSTVANRNFSETISTILANTNVLGNGSFNFYRFNGDVLVSHNLFLAMYVKYGIPGLLILTGLFFFHIRILYKIIKAPSTRSVKKEAVIYLIILLALIFQELKISAIRNISVILIYTFFLFNIYSLYIRNKLLGKELKGGSEIKRQAI